MAGSRVCVGGGLGVLGVGSVESKTRVYNQKKERMSNDDTTTSLRTTCEKQAKWS